MYSASPHIAFIGPGGPEFIVVLLVLLMMFGAKDAPRILRKFYDILNQVRRTADQFKREVLYSDLDRNEATTPGAGDEGEYDAYGADYACPEDSAAEAARAEGAAENDPSAEEGDVPKD